eukprot:11052465-Prorocentrum_lima.AAC.1
MVGKDSSAVSVCQGGLVVRPRLWRRSGRPRHRWDEQTLQDFWNQMRKEIPTIRLWNVKGNKKEH